MTRTPYRERNDIEKLESQWVKRRGHMEKQDYSAAIVRMATAAEIAGNIAVRHEFSEASGLEAGQVDSFLIWANGLDGKMRRLLLPLRYKNKESNREYKRLLLLAYEINKHRNAIVHRGEFRSRKIANELQEYAIEFIQKMIRRSHDGYVLPPDDD